MPSYPRTVKAFRWRMFGHTLKGLEGWRTAYLAILVAIYAETDIIFKGRRGRPSLKLIDMIRNDLKRKKISNSQRSVSDFEDL